MGSLIASLDCLTFHTDDQADEACNLNLSHRRWLIQQERSGRRIAGPEESLRRSFPECRDRWSQRKETMNIAGRKSLRPGFLAISIVTPLVFFPISAIGQCEGALTSAGDGSGGSRLQESKTVTDVDGNTYPIVTFGTQLWMAENLRTTHYRNGDAIPELTEGAEGEDPASGASCTYEYNPENEATFGRMYTWHAAMDERGLCPQGFHVPTEEEWNTLADLLGGIYSAGGLVKAPGYAGWEAPNPDPEKGGAFMALPGGVRDTDGSFYFLGSNAYFWSSTERPDEAGFGYYRYISGGMELLNGGFYAKGVAMSVRCMGDSGQDSQSR